MLVTPIKNTRERDGKAFPIARLENGVIGFFETDVPVDTEIEVMIIGRGASQICVSPEGVTPKVYRPAIVFLAPVDKARHSLMYVPGFVNDAPVERDGKTVVFYSSRVPVPNGRTLMVQAGRVPVYRTTRGTDESTHSSEVYSCEVWVEQIKKGIYKAVGLTGFQDIDHMVQISRGEMEPKLKERPARTEATHPRTHAPRDSKRDSNSTSRPMRNLRDKMIAAGA